MGSGVRSFIPVGDKLLLEVRWKRPGHVSLDPHEINLLVERVTSVHWEAVTVN